MQRQKEFIFFKEWLVLPKEQFRILLYLARNSSFCGNLSDLCRYFSLNPQNKNRKALGNAIEALTEGGYIKCDKSGRTYELTIIPKEEETSLECGWVDEILEKPFSASVSKEAVIKVLLWLKNHGSELLTNNEIAEGTNLSVTTINAAKNVLCKS